MLCCIVGSPGCNEIIATGRFHVVDAGAVADASMDGSVPRDAGVDACTTSTFYRDSDEDTFGDPDDTISTCEAPSGYVDNAEDCDDSRLDVNPDGVEVCDDVDQDCDGVLDDGLMGPVGDVIELVPADCCREFTVGARRWAPS